MKIFICWLSLFFTSVLFPFPSFCQGKKHKQVPENKGRYNKIDEQGRYQGFWKIMLPDGMGHGSNYAEGFYYNK